jgi:tetratricopeptide (TPR) repeat protein
MNTLVKFAFIVSVFFCSKVGFAQEDKDKFKRLVEEADAQLSRREYLKARDAYKQALALKPTDKQLKEKIEDCNEHLKRPYEAIMREAEKAFSMGQFAKASKIYQESLVYFDSDKARENIEKSKVAPQNVFAKSIGGKGYEEARKIISTRDGNWVCLGRTTSKTTGNSDVYLVKINSSGSVLWEKNYGGKEEEQGCSLVELADGGFILAGYSDTADDSDSPSNKNIYLVRCDASGNKIWDKHIGSSQTIEEAKAIMATKDGNFFVLGNSMNLNTKPNEEPNNDIILLKINEKGELLWQKSYGTASNDEANGFTSTEEGLVIVGATEDKGRWDMYLLALDDQGNELWSKIHGGGEKDTGNDIIRDRDGNFIVSGLTYSYATSGSHDLWAIKLSPKGERIWSKVFGGLSVDEGLALIETTEGNYVLVGYSEDFERDEYGENISLERLNVFLIQLTPNGSLVWQRSFGGERDQRGFDLVQTQSGFLVVGTHQNSDENKEDMLLMKFNNEGMSVSVE